MLIVATKSSKWLNQKFLQWQSASGERKNISEFAEYLEVGEAALGHWLIGRRNPNFENSLKICRKLHDFELMGILGFQIPPDSIAYLPEDFRNRLGLAIRETREALAGYAHDKDSEEIVKISTEIFERHGFKYTGKDKDVAGSKK